MLHASEGNTKNFVEECDLGGRSNQLYLAKYISSDYFPRILYTFSQKKKEKKKNSINYINSSKE